VGENVPRIARNSCPLCGEVIPLRWWELLPSGVGLAIHFAGVGNKPVLWGASVAGYLLGATLLGKLGLRLEVEGRD
jgi:hypothetical protein